MGINAQVTELRAAKDRILAEVDGVAQRFAETVASLNEKIASLGEVDPDISADVADLMAQAEELKNIGAKPTEPEPAPVEPAPVEPGV